MKEGAALTSALGTVMLMVSIALDSIPIAIFGGVVLLSAFLLGCTAEIKESLKKLAK